MRSSVFRFVVNCENLSAVTSDLLQRLLQRRTQLGEILAYVFAEMHAQRAAAAFGQHREIAASLRGLHDAERVFLFGHREIDGVVAGDLQETRREFGPPL